MFLSLLHSLFETKKRIFCNTNLQNDSVKCVEKHVPKKQINRLSWPTVQEINRRRVCQLRIYRLGARSQVSIVAPFCRGGRVSIYDYCGGRGTV